MGIVKRKLGPELNRGDRAACDEATCHDPADHKRGRGRDEPPQNPELHLDDVGNSVEEQVELILVSLRL